MACLSSACLACSFYFALEVFFHKVAILTGFADTRPFIRATIPTSFSKVSQTDHIPTELAEEHVQYHSRAEEVRYSRQIEQALLRYIRSYSICELHKLRRSGLSKDDGSGWVSRKVWKAAIFFFLSLAE
jgi:hypothetical protein